MDSLLSHIWHTYQIKPHRQKSIAQRAKAAVKNHIQICGPLDAETYSRCLLSGVELLAKTYHDAATAREAARAASIEPVVTTTMASMAADQPSKLLAHQLLPLPLLSPASGCPPLPTETFP
jgi:hypothetical protein